MKRFNKGFTLVELLIVAGIIGILSTLLMSNFIGVRQRARDAQRKSDLKQIQSAIEIYRSDLNSYPSAPLPSCGSPLTGGNPANTYMQKIPCDPNGSSYYNSGNYYYTSGTSTYSLGACLENSADPQGTSTPPPGGGSGCSTNWYYVVTNP
jgi:general secretion pathway protein G